MMDLGYLVSNGRYIDCADNDFASFACLSSHLDSCLDSLIEMSSIGFRMKIKTTLKIKRIVLYMPCLYTEVQRLSRIHLYLNIIENRIKETTL